MPLPHICSEIVFLVGSGSRRQVVFTRPVTPFMTEQIFPTLHGEKLLSPDWETGFIMKRPSAGHTVELNGQQAGDVGQLPLQS
jgi:hypothetical protein